MLLGVNKRVAWLLDSQLLQWLLSAGSNQRSAYIVTIIIIIHPLTLLNLNLFKQLLRVPPTNLPRRQLHTPLRHIWAPFHIHLDTSLGHIEYLLYLLGPVVKLKL